VKLIVTEKPSVGRDIAKVLKVSGKSDGYLHNDSYVISWAIGHLITLCDPEDYDAALKRWKIDALPIIPGELRLKAIYKTKKQLNVLSKWMKSSKITEIICATDAGREGELIFRYIYDFVGCKKPVKRLWISSMTDDAIKNGFASLRPSADFDDLYYSARCRSYADWLVGINASRAYSLTHNAHLTIGRVQTPTLAIIVARQKEIDSFIPKDYWEVHADFAAEIGQYSGKWFSETNKDGKIDTKEAADEIAKKVRGQEGVVKSAEREEKRQPPPLLYDLAELQRDCNRRYGLSAAKTLSIAQDLYEKHKLITYPRTDSRHLSKDIKLNPIINALGSKAEYAEYVKYIHLLDKLPITSRIVDDSKVTDHHAIIPTEKKSQINLPENEKRVYELIARRFLSAFYPAHIRNITTVTTVVMNESFLSKGSEVLQMGWKELYSDDKSDEDEGILPPLVKGQISKAVKAGAKAKKTQPPKPYTEATLLSAMENAGKTVENEEIAKQMKENGLGTAATRASIIERLLAVEYIVRKGKNLAPTEKAVQLIQILPAEITSAETTGRWEKGLSSISKGSMNPDRFMGSIEKFVRFLVDNAQSSPKDIVFAAEKPGNGKGAKKSRKSASLGKCPVCGGDVLENSKSFYCAGWKKGCKFNIWKNSVKNYNYEITSSDISNLLSGKAVKDIQLILPDTKEKAAAELILDIQSASTVRFINLRRI